MRDNDVIKWRHHLKHSEIILWCFKYVNTNCSENSSSKLQFGEFVQDEEDENFWKKSKDE